MDGRIDGGAIEMSTKEKTTVSQGLLTVKDCADYLRCSVSLVESFIRSGEIRRVPLTSRQVGRPAGDRSRPGPKNWRVRPEALEEFIRSREGREVPAVAEESPRAKGRGVSGPTLAPLPSETGKDGKRRLGV